LNGGGDLENKKSELSGKFRVLGTDSADGIAGGGGEGPEALPMPLPDPARLDKIFPRRFSGSDM